MKFSHRSFPTLAALALLAILVSACTTTAAIGPAARLGVPALTVLRATLDNGLRVIIVRDPLAPVATQQTTYFVGSNESPDGFPGTAHAQEHMMFRGSPGITGDQLAAISAQLGGDMNAFTTQDITSYYFTVPSDQLDVTLRIGALRMAAVDDRQADWEKERGAIEQEVARDNSDPFYTLYTKALAHLFAGTPYEHDGLGTKPSFDATDATALKRFHDTWYAPNNALLVVTGDVDPPVVLKEIRTLYGAIPSKRVPPKPAIELRPVQPEVYRSTTDQPYGIVAIEFRMPGYRDPDFAAASVLSDALNSSRGAIADLTFQGRALDSGFGMDSMVHGGVGYAYALFPPGGDAASLEADLKAAIEASVSHGISRDLVDAERRALVLGNNLARNSIAGLASSWTEAVALDGSDSPDTVAARLEQVSYGTVNDAARRLIDLGHAVTMILNPSPGARAQGGGQFFGTPESFNASPTAAIELPAWAATSLAALPHPEPLFRPTVDRLPNGLRLIVQPMATSDSVTLYGSVRTNEALQAPKGEEGVDGLLNTLFQWGPAGMTRTEFEARADAIGADLAPGTSFSLAVLPDSFDKAVGLLADDLLHPALPAEAFATQQRIQAQEAAGRERSPLFQFDQSLQHALLPSGDPALRIPTGQSIAGLTLDRVKSYYDTVMRPDEAVIVVIGNIDAGAARATIEKYFGSWSAQGAKPVLDDPAIARNASGELFVPDPVREQDRVVLAETVPVTFNDEDHYALELGNEYLGGGLFASPLYRELRVQRGLVYSVSSSLHVGRTRSQYQIAFGADPSKVAEAKQVALRVLSGMIEHPMSDGDLHLAKEIGLHRIELADQSVGDIAGQWLGYSQLELPLDRLYLVARHYESLTAPEVQAAFRKYIDEGRLVTAILGVQPH